MDTIRTTGELESREISFERELSPDAVALTFLGGVGEFGKNMLLLEDEAGIVVIDCGQAFPDDTLLGVDSVICDVGYLEAHAERVLGYVITHGHEDHIGALPYVLPQAPAPIYGTRLTLGLINGKLREYKQLPKVQRIEIEEGAAFELGGFTFEPFAVAHSVADSIGLVIETRSGTIVHTGDFKIDRDPVDGRRTDLRRLRGLGKAGVRLLLSDSTNAELTGHSRSEGVVAEALDEAFARTRGRILVTTFSSHIHRLQNIADACRRHDRSLVVTGRSVERNVRIARELGYLEIPANLLVNAKHVDQLPAGRLCMIVSGSQGEPLSALARIVTGEHKHIKLEPDDLVIFSAKIIPGNEVAINRMIDRILAHQCEVLYEGLSDIHVSGHAYGDELREVLAAVRPEYFIPVHGELRQLHAHRRIALEAGLEERAVYTPHLGARLLLDEGGLHWGEPVTAGRVLVDGKGVGDVGPIVLRDRMTMADDGILVIIVIIRRQSGEVLREVELVTRGLVYIDENEAFLEDVTEKIHELIQSAEVDVREDEELLGDWLRRKTRRFIQKRLERRPLVVPVIYEL